MQRIDGATAAPSLPAPSAIIGTPGFFTGGNPNTPTPPTGVTPDFLNMIQEELVAIVLAAGLALDKSNYGQVLAAIRALIATGGISLASDADAIAGTSTTKAVTPHSATALVNARITALVGGAPTALDTLKELADAIADDANFAASMTGALAARVPTSRQVLGGGVATGGGPLTGDVTITVAAASGTDVNAGISTTEVITPAGYAAGGGGTWANGWSVIPGGFIEQWGSVAMQPSGTSTVIGQIVFPVAFAQGCGTINGNCDDGVSSNWRPVAVTFPGGPSPTGSTVLIDSTDPNKQFNAVRRVYWRAIGK